MATKITYSCDRCNKERESKNGLFEISVKAKSLSKFDDYEYNVPKSPQMWCEACMDSLQLQRLPKEVDVGPTPKILTLEEKLTDILREFIQENQFQQ